MTTHDSYTDRLSDYLDEEDLPARERDAIAAHLEQCEPCRRTLDELRKVAAQAAALEDTPPMTELWPGVVARLEPRPRRGFTLFRRDTPSRRFSFTLPQLAAASVLIALASGAVAWSIGIRSTRSREPERVVATSPSQSEASPERTIATVGLADAQYDAAVAELQRALDKGRGHLDPATIQILEQNLTIIDRAIADAQRAVADDPGNTYLTTHLVEARRKKIDLLRRATALTTEMD
jgi:anti-sigma factor RsiW